MIESYQPSGRFSAAGLIGLPLVAGLSSIILAIVYVLAVWFIPIIYLNFLAPIVWGILVAVCAGLVIKKFKMRAPMLAALLSCLGAVLGYVAAWVLWVDMVFNMGEAVSLGSRMGFAKTGFNVGEIISLLLNPKEFIMTIKEINSIGTWSIGRGQSGAVSGLFLTIVWAIEALIYFGAIAGATYAKSAAPFSEETEEWLKEIALPRAAAVPMEESQFQSMENALKSGDISQLLKASPENMPDMNSHLKMVLFVGGEHEKHYINITLAKVTLGKKKSEVKDTSWIKHLAVTSAQSRELQSIFG